MHRYLDDGDQPYAPDDPGSPEDDDDLDQPPPEVQEAQGNQAAMAGNPMAVPDDSYYSGASAIPGTTNVTPDMLSAPAAPSAPAGPPPVSDYSQKLQALSKLYNQYPQRKAPNWLERIAAGALGGAAGYSNAARRAAPIDIAKATEPILYPGYDQQVAQWQSKVVPAQQAVEIAGQQAAAGWKGQQIGAESALKGAQLGYYQQRGQYYANLNPSRLVTVTPEMETATGGKVHQGTQIPASVAAKIYDDVIKGGNQMKVTDPDMAKRLGVAVGTSVPNSIYQTGVTAGARAAAPHNVTEWESRLQANGGDSAKALAAKQQDEIHRAQQSRDPLTDVLRNDMLDRRKQQDLDSIGNWKLNQERAITQQRDQKLASLTQNSRAGVDIPSEVRRINGETQAQLQNIQNTFAQRARAKGVQTDDYDVGVDYSRNAMGNIAYTPRQVAPVRATPPPPPVAPRGGPAVRPPAIRPVTVPPEIAAGLLVGVPRKVNSPNGPMTVVKQQDGTVVQQQ